MWDITYWMMMFEFCTIGKAEGGFMQSFGKELYDQ